MPQVVTLGVLSSEGPAQVQVLVRDRRVMVDRAHLALLEEGSCGGGDVWLELALGQLSVVARFEETRADD